MKSFMTFLIALVIALASEPFIPRAAAQESKSKVLDAAAYRAMNEDIEIMRRVLVKELMDHFGVGYTLGKTLFDQLDKDEDDEGSGKTAYSRAQNLFEYGLRWHGQNHYNSRGFYVPGSGVVLSLDVDVPVKEAPKKKKKAQTSRNLWEEAEKEYRQGSSSASSFTNVKKEEQKSWILDSETIEEVIDILVETVARNGTNMEHLSPRDRFTLLVTFKGDRSLDKLAMATRDARLALSSFYATYSAQPLKEDVIVQIPASIASRIEEGADVEDVKRAAKVIRYPAKGEVKESGKSF